MSWIQSTADGIVLHCRVVPRASANQVGPPMDNTLKIRIQAPPVDGKANKALILFLADTLHVPRNRITLVAGSTGHTKHLHVQGISIAQARQRLGCWQRVGLSSDSLPVRVL